MSVTMGRLRRRPDLPTGPGVVLIGLLAAGVAATAAGSLLLIPGKLEVSQTALMRGDTGAAAAALVAALASDAAPQPGQVAPLVDLALDLGEPDQAAELLRRYLAGHPDDIAAVKRLADVLEQAHREPAMAAVLERLYALTHDVEALRLALGIYQSRGMTTDRLRVLNTLYALGSETPDQLLDLAHLRAAAGDRAAALDVLLSRAENAPTGPVASAVAGLAAAMSIGQPDAADLAARLGRSVPNTDLLASLVHTYTQRAAAPLGLAAARAARPELQETPAVTLMLAQLEAETGDTAQAYRRLDARRRAGTLDPAAAPLLLELDLDRGDAEAALALAGTVPLGTIPVGAGARLVDLAWSRGRMDVVRTIDPARFPAEPQVAAVVYLARGNRPAALEAARQALADPVDLPGSSSAYRSALRTLGLDAEAFARVLDVVRLGNAGTQGYRLLAEFAADDPSRAAAALPVLEGLRDTKEGAGGAWLRMRARQGDDAATATWLRDGRLAAGLDTETLVDVLAVAIQRRERTLLGVVGRRLQGRTDLPPGWSQPEVALLTHSIDPLTPVTLRAALDLLASPGTGTDARTRIAQMVAGAPNAVELMRTVRPADTQAVVAVLVRDINADEGGDEAVAARLALLLPLDPAAAREPLARRVARDPARYAPLQVAALLLGGRTADAQAALQRLLQSLPPARREAALYGIRTVVGPGLELPVLQMAAGLLGGQWQSAYEDGLARSGRPGELAAYILQRANAPGLPAAARRAMVGRLVEIGDTAAAITVLRATAGNEPPDSQDVQMLLNLYGPTANPAALAWFSARAVRSPPGAFRAWLEALDYLGSPEAVATAIEARPELFARDPKLADLYAGTLVRLHAPGRGAKLLARAAETTTDPRMLMALGRSAEDTNQAELFRSLSSRAATAAPTDAQALLQAARAASNGRRSAEAASLYDRLLALGPQPADVMADAAQMFKEQHRAGDAASTARTALAKLPDRPATIPQARLRARILHQLGRDQEAAAILSDFLKTAPRDAGLQADLLQIGVDRSD